MSPTSSGGLEDPEIEVIRRSEITQRLTTPAQLAEWVRLNDDIRSDPTELEADLRTATGEDRNHLLRAKRERAVIDIAFYRSRQEVQEEEEARRRYLSVPQAIRCESGASTPIEASAPADRAQYACPAPGTNAGSSSTETPVGGNTSSNSGGGGSSSGVAIAAAGAGAVGIGYLVWLFWPDSEVVPYAIGSNDGYGYRFGVERRFGNHRLGIHHEPENDAAGIRWEFRW